MVGIAAASLWTCQRGHSHGTLEVRLKDHREAIGDFARLEVGVETLRLRAKAGLKSSRPGWKELDPSVPEIDLTKFSGKHSALVFKGELEPGQFEAIHLELGQVEGILKKSQDKILIKNLIGPIRLTFSVRKKEETLIVLDLTVIDISDHPPRGYELHIQGYELYTNGTLVDKVPPG